MITFYYFCLYVSLGDAYLLHPSEAHFVLWGDITNFDSLMLPADDEVGEHTHTDTKTEDKLEEVLDDSFQMPFAFEDLLETNRDRDSLDSKDLDVATSDLYQAFSKWDPTQQYETDKHLMRAFRRFDGSYEGLHFRSGLNKSEMERISNREFEMCTKVNNLGLQFLLHSRHKLAEALDQREDIRKDKRYRLGYLFNRLRRLTIEMKKVVGTGKQIERQIYDVKNTNTIANEKIRSLKTMLRLYEQMVRYDVDVRDTLRLIKAVFMEPADFNYPFLGYPTKPTTTTGAP